MIHVRPRTSQLVSLTLNVMAVRTRRAAANQAANPRMHSAWQSIGIAPGCGEPQPARLATEMSNEEHLFRVPRILQQRPAVAGALGRDTPNACIIVEVWSLHVACMQTHRPVAQTMACAIPIKAHEPKLSFFF